MVWIKSLNLRVKVGILKVEYKNNKFKYIDYNSIIFVGTNLELKFNWRDTPACILSFSIWYFIIDNFYSFWQGRKKQFAFLYPGISFIQNSYLFKNIFIMKSKLNIFQSYFWRNILISYLKRRKEEQSLLILTKNGLS